MKRDHTSLRDALPAAGASPAAQNADSAAQAALPDLAVTVKGLTKTYKASSPNSDSDAAA